jgi:hypothetical protein
MTTQKETGQVAYEAYANTRHWMDTEGKVMRQWDEVPEALRDAFRAAAHAAITHGWVEAQH